MKVKSIFLFNILLIMGGCVPQKIVKPLQTGQKQLNASIGGPLIAFAGTTIPIPLTSINYAQGVTDSLTFHGGLQLTSLAYKTIQLDAGATYGIIKPKGWQPGLSASGSLNVLTDLRETAFRIYPQLDVNAYWDYGQNHFMYFGVTNWIELNGNRAHEEEQNQQILSGIQFGNTFTQGKWSFTLESKWLAPTRNTRNLTIDYKTYQLGGEPKGAVGVYFGITKILGK